MFDYFLCEVVPKKRFETPDHAAFPMEVIAATDCSEAIARYSGKVHQFSGEYLKYSVIPLDAEKARKLQKLLAHVDRISLAVGEPITDFRAQINELKKTMLEVGMLYSYIQLHKRIQTFFSKV